MPDSWALTIPRETANDDFVILVQWLAEEGERVEAGVPVVLFETSKATVELVAPQSGYVVRSVAESAEVPIGAVIGTIHAHRPTCDPTPTLAPRVEAPSALPNGTSEHRPGDEVAVPYAAAGPVQRWSNKAAALAEQHGLSRELLKDVPLVREQDVRTFLATLTLVTPASPAVPLPQTPRANVSRVERIAPLSAMKRTEVRYLRAGNADALVSTITVSVDASRLDRRIAAARQQRLSYLALLLPVVARMLREQPELNAFLRDDGVHYYADVNIGVAVNLGEGLFVPVITAADQMTSEQVASHVSNLVMKAVRGELREADLVGGTFTITDLTDAGAVQVLPLLNRNQSAILGVGRNADSTPPRLILTLAFDHRVSDGLQAAQFLGAIKHELEADGGAQIPLPATPTCSSCRVTVSRLRRDGAGDFLISVVKESGEQGLLCPTCLLGFTS